MPASHGKNTVVLVGQNNLSSYLNNVDSSKTADTHETTTFTKDAKTYAAGQKDGTLAMSGLFDGVADAVDEELDAILGGTAQVVTIGLEGMAATKRCRLLQALETEYNVSAPVSDMVAVDAAMQADGGIDAGVSLHPPTAVGAGNGTAVDNGSATTNGGVAHLHALAFTGTTATVKVRHSADNVTYVDLVTFDAVTTKGAQRKTVSGTVNRYLQTNISGTFTSITPAVAFARRL